MTNPIQLLRDFLKRRRERRKKAISDYVFNRLIGRAEFKDFPIFISAYDRKMFREGILYGIEHRKEILKQVKI